MLLHGLCKWLYPWKVSDLVLCPAVQVCGQLGTRLGLVYETIVWGWNLRLQGLSTALVWV